MRVAALVALIAAALLPAHAMADLIDHSIAIPALALSSGALFETAKTQSAKNSRRN